MSQIEVAKEDKLKLARALTAREMTQYLGDLGSVVWLVDHCSPR